MHVPREHLRPPSSRHRSGLTKRARHKTARPGALVACRVCLFARVGNRASLLVTVRFWLLRGVSAAAQHLLSLTVL